MLMKIIPAPLSPGLHFNGHLPREVPFEGHSVFSENLMVPGTTVSGIPNPRSFNALEHLICADVVGGVYDRTFYGRPTIATNPIGGLIAKALGDRTIINGSLQVYAFEAERVTDHPSCPPYKWLRQALGRTVLMQGTVVGRSTRQPAGTLSLEASYVRQPPRNTVWRVFGGLEVPDQSPPAPSDPSAAPPAPRKRGKPISIRNPRGRKIW